jgi:hypothetical protein
MVQRAAQCRPHELSRLRGQGSRLFNAEFLPEPLENFSAPKGCEDASGHSNVVVQLRPKTVEFHLLDGDRFLTIPDTNLSSRCTNLHSRSSGIGLRNVQNTPVFTH